MANGIISSLQIGSGDVGVFTTPYGVCSSIPNNNAKTVTVQGDFVLGLGAKVTVKFENENMMSPATLNVNSTGAKNISYKGSTSITNYFNKAGTYDFVYDGTNWEIIGYLHTMEAGSYHIPAGGSTDQYLIYGGYSGTAAWASGFGKYISASGIVLGTDLTSNTVSTYGGGNSIAAGSSNTFSKNVSLCYTFGESNNITDTSSEGTSDGVTKYVFFAGYGNKLNTSYPRSTGSVAIGLNNIICSGKTSTPTAITGTSSHLCASVALGAGNTVGSSSSAGYAIGAGNTVGGSGASAMGRQNTSSGSASVAMGYNNTASNSYSVALGYGNDATSTGAVAIGYNTTASGNYSVALGYYNTASGGYSTALGYNNTAAAYQTTVGKYAKAKDGATSATTTSGFPFLVGNGTGTGTSTSNAFWVYSSGICYAEGTFTGSTASDYAECFEWSDNNPNNEDRRGRFVTFDFDDKIRFANANDDYILGIVSATPTVLGDAAADEWHGRYIRDIYGNIVEEEVDVEEIIDEETGEILEPARKEKRRKINPDYNPNQSYIPRYERPEWSAIGMMGKLVLDDDGTCEVGGFAAPGKDGIATRGTSINGYKVIARLDENHVRVIFK